jgi:hypothetical protein
MTVFPNRTPVKISDYDDARDNPGLLLFMNRINFSSFFFIIFVIHPNGGCQPAAFPGDAENLTALLEFNIMILKS